MCPILIAMRLSSNANPTYVPSAFSHEAQRINNPILMVLQPKAEQFNCAQRAHSNFLENASQTMLFTLVAGLKYPDLAPVLGAAWLVCRSLFLYGYVFSGKPQGKGRLIGSFFWLIQGALWGLSVFGVGKELISY